MGIDLDCVRVERHSPINLGSSDVPPKTKANPRKQELKDALDKAKPASDHIPSILKGASDAMTAKAWTGGTSADFGSGLSDQVGKAKKGGTDSVAEIQHAYDTCPSEIPDDGGN